MVTELMLFIGACLLMLVSGTAIIKYLEVITAFLKMREFTVGFILIGISTSLPELFVGINSALRKTPAITLGNVIGANILDLTLVLGIIVLFAREIKYQHKAVAHDSWAMIAAAASPVILMVIGGSLSRIDGIILIAIFAVYLYRLISKKKTFTKEFVDKESRWKVVLSMLALVSSVVLLMISTGWVVKYGSELALGMALPPIFIGIFFISIGTTLPELVTGLMSIKQHHPDFAIGDIVGSIITNSLLVIGVTALIFPITADAFLFITSTAYMLLVCFLFATFVESGKKLIWQEGVAMILLYVFFLIVELNLKGFF